MRRQTRVFLVVRDVDETGISGTGVVARGAQFPNDWCVMVWCTENTPPTLGFYASIDDLIRIHGHGGKTRVVWTEYCTAGLRWNPGGQVHTCIKEPGHKGAHWCHESGLSWVDHNEGAIPPIPEGV